MDMTNILQKIKHEFLKVLPTMIFFLVAFNIVAITSAQMLREHGIEVRSILGATILALVVSKVILLVDHLPFVNKFPDKPLIYNIVWKTFLYMLAVLLARYFEHFPQGRRWNYRSAPALDERNSLAALPGYPYLVDGAVFFLFDFSRACSRSGQRTHGQAVLWMRSKDGNAACHKSWFDKIWWPEKIKLVK